MKIPLARHANRTHYYVASMASLSESPAFTEALQKLELSFQEFCVCAGFWLAVYVVTSFISLNHVLGAHRVHGTLTHTTLHYHPFLCDLFKLNRLLTDAHL